MIDRLVDQAEIVPLGGEPYRLKPRPRLPPDAAYNLAYLSDASVKLLTEPTQRERR